MTLNAFFLANKITPNKYEREVIQDIIDGGKSDVWTKASDICAYLELSEVMYKNEIVGHLTPKKP